MATTKIKAIAKAAEQVMTKFADGDVIVLHCKCDACTNWEIEYNTFTHNYTLVCASCKEEAPLTTFSFEPHASFHFEKVE